MDGKQKKSHFHSTSGNVSVINGVVWVETPNVRIFWDAGAFRPDPRDELKTGRTYKASIVFDTENLPSGAIVEFPRTFTISSKKTKKTFTNIR
jgi:hypothetical protein